AARLRGLGQATPASPDSRHRAALRAGPPALSGRKARRGHLRMAPGARPRSPTRQCQEEPGPGGKAPESPRPAQEEVAAQSGASRARYLSAKYTIRSPSTIRYHPKPTKVWLWMNRRSHRTTMNATTAETSVPSATMLHAVCSGLGTFRSL